MAAPYTEGKNGTGHSSGHTSTGVHRPAGNTTPATSNENTRIGNLGTRTHGMGCDCRKP